ncbi:HIT family protein [Patescibacteria group bacterium]|nr:HIT family protein [Patescibacteria group bacterium]MBU4022871.1 HIT family protein [Patescibacteria group bacterium]MBU4078119.1 HIT family protein [Patescibacteria group bacterium]
MNCVFCEIDKERTRIIEEKEYTLVILSNHRLMEGHLLVIPKRHVEKISELNKEEKKELFDTVTEYQEKILKNIAKGCDIRQNYRPFQAEDNLKVDHLHIHLQPREFEDELYDKSQIFEKEVFKELPAEEAKRISDLLKK